MIVVPSPLRDAAEAARRAGRGRLPVWLVSPGEGDVGIEREVVACDPVRLVRGSSAEGLEAAWREERGAWPDAGPGVPIGVGYLGYDLGRRFERLRGPAPPTSGWPDLEFRFYDAVWIRDRGGAAIHARDRGAAARLAARLAEPGGPAAPGAGGIGPLVPLEPPEHHLAGVARVLAYLQAGDAYQVNLARRLQAPLLPDPGPLGWALFARLQAESPAPHAAWIADPEEGECLIGNSPERFLRLTADGAVETRPIKGTRPRRPGAEAELVHHPKDLAELTMIVDLERNDLGRVCATGSVAVSGFPRLLTLPTVHHLVATVSGRLRPGVGLAGLLRATFPGGSVTGAPKVRAMEIIDELEPARRGPYTGATGWLGAAGDLDLAVAIRTALVREGRLTLWVGGGVVVDSEPAAELAETETKARAFAQLASPPRSAPTQDF